jgi:O-antigen/teichoic acid export membrane protein
MGEVPQTARRDAASVVDPRLTSILSPHEVASRLRSGILSPVTQTFATTIAIIALGLLSGIELARALGPDGRGQVAAALLWPGLLIYLGAIGLTQAIVIFSAADDDRDSVSAVFSTAVCLGLLLSFVTMVAGVVFVPMMLRSQSPEVVSASRLFLLAVPAGMLSGFVVAILQGLRRFTRLNMVRLIIPVGYVLGLTVLMAMHRLTVIRVVLLQLLLSYVTLLLGSVVLLREGVVFSPKYVDIKLARKLLRFGSRAYVGTLSGTITQRLDQTLVAAWFPAAQLGLYSVAVSTAGATDTITFAFRTVASGTIAQKASAADKWTELRRTLAQFLPILLIGAGLLALFLPKLVPLLYGSAFRGAVLPAEILLFGQAVYGTKTLLTSAAEAFGDSWLGSKAELAGLGPIGLLLLLLLPKYGIMGAAVATAVGSSIQLAVMIFSWPYRAAPRP